MNKWVFSIILISCFLILSVLAALTAPATMSYKALDSFLDGAFGVIALELCGILYAAYKLTGNMKIRAVMFGFIILAFMKVIQIYLQSNLYFGAGYWLPLDLLRLAGIFMIFKGLWRIAK